MGKRPPAALLGPLGTSPPAARAPAPPSPKEADLRWDGPPAGPELPARKRVVLPAQQAWRPGTGLRVQSCCSCNSFHGGRGPRGGGRDGQGQEQVLTPRSPTRIPGGAQQGLGAGTGMGGGRNRNRPPGHAPAPQGVLSRAWQRGRARQGQEQVPSPPGLPTSCTASGPARPHPAQEGGREVFPSRIQALGSAAGGRGRGRGSPQQPRPPGQQVPGPGPLGRDGRAP